MTCLADNTIRTQYVSVWQVYRQSQSTVSEAVNSISPYPIKYFKPELIMHQIIDPAILYWASAVIIVSTTNLDRTTNLAPMSLAWWLGQRGILGLAAQSQTIIDLQQTKQCVINLPCNTMLPQINALAKMSGTQNLPVFKTAAGYHYIKDNFRVAQLTPLASEMVEP